MGRLTERDITFDGTSFTQIEDIGLTPEQLLQVDKMYEDRCREIAELEGRRKRK